MAAAIEAVVSTAVTGVVAVVMTLCTRMTTNRNLIRQSVLGKGDGHQNASRNSNSLFYGLKNIQNVLLCDIAPPDD
jgi:hypothetical protein